LLCPQLGTSIVGGPGGTEPLASRRRRHHMAWHGGRDSKLKDQATAGFCWCLLVLLSRAVVRQPGLGNWELDPLALGSATSGDWTLSRC
jgi:hypothetical protein